MVSWRSTDRIFRAFFLGCIVLICTGCAANTPFVVDEYDQVNEVLTDLEQNYEAENTDAFMKRVGRDYMLDYSALERSVNEELDDFTGFDIDLYVDRVSMDDDTGMIFAETHWTKRRISLNTGREFMIEGETVFIFRALPDGNLILKGMKGDPVFGKR